jgi:hypothetical protein
MDVFKSTFTEYSRLNFKHTRDADDLLEFKQKSISDSIDEQVIPEGEGFGVYMELVKRYPHASNGTKRKWKKRLIR